MQIENNKVVTIHYSVDGEAGERIESSRDRGTPIEILVGHGGVIAGVEKALLGRAEGDRFTVDVEPSEVRRRLVVRAELPAAQADRLAELVGERAHRIPLQHLTGRAYFRHLTLQVGPGVFVPRPETEVVAGLAIDAARAAGPAPLVVDLCTGSGAIALAVAQEVPSAQVSAVELSPLAVAWARRNIEALEIRLLNNFV